MTNTLTKKIVLPISGKRLITSDLCLRGAIPHLSPEILTHQFYVLHKKVSKMNRPPPKKKLNVLIACEESQTSCIAFRELGHNAFSCDLQPCSGGHPEWHIQGDAVEQLARDWDLVIAHPPCTFLTAAAARYMWANHHIDKDRLEKAMQARELFYKFYNADCPHIAIENPRPLKIVNLPWATQVVQPYEFGEPWSKETHLWLKDLPLLRPTKILAKFKSYTHCTKGSVQRSKTFPGLAAAWAVQWSTFILESDYP